MGFVEKVQISLVAGTLNGVGWGVALGAFAYAAQGFGISLPTVNVAVGGFGLGLLFSLAKLYKSEQKKE